MAKLTVVAPGGFQYFPIFGDYGSGTNFFVGFSGFSHKFATGFRANSGSMLLQANGTGIAYDPQGNIVDGTITALTFKNGASTIFTFTGLAFDAGAFQQAIERGVAFSNSTFRSMFASPDTTLVGSNGDEDVRTGNGNDSINLGGGGDYLELAGGNDTIDGGAGEDYISYRWFEGIRGISVDLQAQTIVDQFGDTDRFKNVEIIEGTMLNDRFFGSGEDDYIRSADEGRDRYDGRGGSDYLDYQDNPGSLGITADLGQGFVIDPFGFRDILVSIEELGATARNDTITGSAADNWLAPFGGADSINGGAGFDVVSYLTDDSSAGIVADLSTGRITDPFGNTDTVSGIEGVSGSDGNDRMTGNAGDNDFFGWMGADTYIGGNGTDQVNYADEDGGTGIVVNLLTGVGKDTFGDAESFTGIEQIYASLYSDRMTGNASDNWFFGLEGNDTIAGGAGNGDVAYYGEDRFYDGGNAGVTVNLAAGTATDGFGDKDALSGIEHVGGTMFNDRVVGSASANRLAGFGGNDTLTGGAGKDLFIINDAALGAGNIDVFTDFVVADDTIGLGEDIFTAIDGDLAASQFRKLAADTPAATTAAHRIIYSTGSGKLFYDADGKGGQAQIHIATLTGSPDGVSHLDFDLFA